MRICQFCHNPAAGRALDKPILQQIGLIYILQGSRVLRDRRRKCVKPHRASLELLDHSQEYAPVNIVLALILNMVWVYIVLRMTDRIERVLGKGGIYVIRKFFGIILLAISARLFTANLTSLIEQFQKAAQ